MDEPVGKQIQTPLAENENPSTFQSIFFRGDKAVPVRVPDYQRAYSWEQKQSELFIGDLVKYRDVGKGYYFGHFIAEDIGEPWEIVDGQQRITTFVLFLMVCRVLSPSGAHASAYSMIERFSTVSYDREALEAIGRDLGALRLADGHSDEGKPPSDDQILKTLSSTRTFTRSQRRIVETLLRFHQAFQKQELEPGKIGGYIEVVMKAHCSHHLTKDKTVAVNIFEMHNTRGIPLTTLEKIKAMLMKFVYDHGGEERKRRAKVGQIQAEFGEIYGMEERLAELSFRGEMTMEQLLRLHLRVVDDGTKNTANDFGLPPTNANPDKLVEYVESRLKDSMDGVQYALNLAKEFKKSVRIVSENLPAWDKEDPLVGDVLILERELSCQFFLIVCRRLERGKDKADGSLGNDSLLLWEKLLFTRDFHGEYYNLKGGRDDFPALFESCGPDEEGVSVVIKRYLADGFRPDRTKGLQSIVAAYLTKYKDSILNGAFSWWRSKITYVIYKYEARRGAKVREVMKGTISVEHILPQDWYWIKKEDDDLKALADESAEWKLFRKKIEDCINGIGNLLLITPGENTSVGNNHPAKKTYKCSGGSYEEHNRNREKWRSSKEWSNLIRARGEEIFKFMLGNLVDACENPRSS